MARRRTTQILDSLHLMNTAQIFKESIRVLLLHPTHFNSISIFLFSPLPISLFISHFLIHHFPTILPSMLQITDELLGQFYLFLPLPKLISETIVHIIICFPSSITFSLLGRAATAQAVSDIYNGINLNGRRILSRSLSAWVKLLHTSFWEFLVLLFLFAGFVAVSAILPRILYACGISSKVLGFWGVLCVLVVPFCVAFAHIVVVGNLARVLSVLEGESCGFDSLIKGKRLLEGRRQVALSMALLSNVGFRLVECLFEFRVCEGNSPWEAPILVSMYSAVLVWDKVVTVIFYYACTLGGLESY